MSTPADAKKAADLLWEILRTADKKGTLAMMLGLALESAAVVLVTWRNDGRVQVTGGATPEAPEELDAEVRRIGEVLRKALGGIELNQ